MFTKKQITSIETLQSEIAFLRGDLNSKNVIVKMLLNDRDGLNVVNKNVNNVVKDINNKEKTEDVNKNISNVCNKNSDFTSQVNFTEEANDFTRVSRKRANKGNITILGDSIVKDVKSFKLNIVFQVTRRFI